MSVSNNYVIPHLAGEAFVEKPPLYYAMAAVLLKVLGGTLGTVGTIRLVSCLCGLLTLFFCYLLARRLGGKDLAMLTVMVLATMGGFVNESHLIRVDVALLFCVTAGVWAMGEAYLGGRGRFLLLAGLFAGLAFLVKGVIGFAFLGIVWMSVFLPWVWPRWKQRHTEQPQFMVGDHLGALAVLAGVVALWIIPFRSMGTAELWEQWFWDNQIGRLFGSSHLGHAGHGDARPFFYLEPLLLAPMPWTPLLAVWIWQTLLSHGTRKKLSKEHILLIGWTAGSLLLLTVASTKRGVYFVPAIPPLAIMVADVMKAGLRGWQGPVYRIIALGCVLFLALQLAVPLLAGQSASLPARHVLLDVLALCYSGYHLALLAAVLAAAYFLFWFPAALSTRVISVVAITYATFLMVNFAALDTKIGLQGKFSAFLHSIPESQRRTAASFHLDERTRGHFYLCDRQVFPAIEVDRVNRALTTGDPDFDSVFVLGTSSLQQVDAPYRIAAQSYFGDRLGKIKERRWVYWLVPDT